MIASERRRYILEALGTKGVVSIRDIARELGVADITVRRDFEKLEADNRLKRVQGGAAALEESDGAELTMSGKLPRNMAEKEAVAALAAALVREGECVFIDGGTTMLPLAARLMRRRIRIVTNNTLVLRKAVHAAAKITLIGGEYLPPYDMSLGPIAEDMLRQFYFDRAFIGCAGLDLARRAVYLTDAESLTIKRIAMERSKSNHLVVDASKFFKRGFLYLCGMDAFDSVLTSPFAYAGTLPENVQFAPCDDTK